MDEENEYLVRSKIINCACAVYVISDTVRVRVAVKQGVAQWWMACPLMIRTQLTL